MTLKQFTEAVNNLALDGDVRRAQLEHIFNDVCEQAVHRLAEMQQQRDKALALLHKHYLLERER